MQEEFLNGESSVTQLPAIANLDGLEVLTPELIALRDARKRAFEARVAAENALRQAEEAEARLRVQEEQAAAAAAAARYEQLAEEAREAAAREAEAIERVALLEAQFHQSSTAKDEAQATAMSVAQACNEARSALEQLIASLAACEEKVTATATHARQVEAMLAASKQRAREATQARERAEAALPSSSPMRPATLPTMTLPVVASVECPAPAAESTETPTVEQPAFFANSALAAQRAAERRAADAERQRSE